MLLKSRTQLAQLYGYSCKRTFMRRLEKKGIKLAAYKALDLSDQLPIYANLGLPPLMSMEEKKQVYPYLEIYCREKSLILPALL